MNDTQAAPTARASLSPVYHYGASAQPKRVAWLVVAEVDGTGEKLRCCESTHGHRTKEAAKACFIKTWNRYRAAAR